MSAPAEVLAAMAEASCGHGGMLCLSCESAGKCLRLSQFEGQKAIVADALAAAEALGWELRPADESADLREAVEELGRAWGFHDRVVASPDDERAAVGSDHHEWCERAARSAIRALATAPRVTP